MYFVAVKVFRDSCSAPLKNYMSVETLDGYMNPTVVAYTSCIVGDNPVWNPVDENLYWCDTRSAKLYRYTPTTGRHVIVDENSSVSGFTVQRDGSLLLFNQQGRVSRWDQGDVTTIVDEIGPKNHVNSVSVDPLGRVLGGTVSERRVDGRLCRLSSNGTIRWVADGIDAPRGIGFSPDLEWMYVTEANVDTIWRFSYDSETGNIGEKTTFVTTREEAGDPSGVAVDANGDLWSARWGGGCLIRYDAEGQERDRIEFPVAKISNVAFGSEDRSRLYVTTAGGDDPEKNGDLAGTLFSLQPDVQGGRQYLSEIDI